MRCTRSPLRRSIGLGAALILAVLSSGALAQNYSVTMNPTLNGLDIKLDPVAQQGMLIVNVTNKSDKKVRCDFEYSAPPQFPDRTSTFVQPGKTEPSVFRASGQPFAVTVNVTCVAVS
jgi:hypothetical protein